MFKVHRYNNSSLKSLLKPYGKVGIKTNMYIRRQTHFCMIDINSIASKKSLMPCKQRQIALKHASLQLLGYQPVLHYAHYSKGEYGCRKPGSTESNQLSNPSSLLYLSPSENDSQVLIGDDMGIWILSLNFGERLQSVRIYNWLMYGSANPLYSALDHFLQFFL